MLRRLLRALTILMIVVGALVIFDYAELLVPVNSKAVVDMDPTIAACTGRAIAEGFTYRIRDPEQGEVVAVHAAETPTGDIVPDKDATDLVLLLRVAAGPGDVIVGRDGTVFVNDIKLDDITTKPFPRSKVPSEQYFLLGDNRSAAIDSRTFGPVLGNAIFARVLVTYWPLRNLSFRLKPELGKPPGPARCG